MCERQTTAGKRHRPLPLLLTPFWTILAIAVSSCSPDHIYPRLYPTSWPALAQINSGACPSLAGRYELDGTPGYAGDSDLVPPIPFESILHRPRARGIRDHLRIENDPGSDRLLLVIEGAYLRWPGEPLGGTEQPQQALSLSFAVTCVDGWIMLPTTVFTGNGGNGETGITKGQELTFFSRAKDKSLIVRQDSDFETTFFPILDVKHVRGNWWVRFQPVF